MPTPTLLAASFHDIYTFFVRGGFFMIPLLACSIIAVAVIIMRALALRRHLIVPTELQKEIERLAPNDTPDAVVRLSRFVRNDPSTLARIAQVGLVNLHQPKDENLNSVQTVARHEVGRLEHGLHLLEIIIGISPLLGLLGAVSGLVTVFGNFGSNAAGADPHRIAAGIAEALSTTVVGIGVAIPTLIAHGLLGKRVETLAADMELLISGLLTKCYNQKLRRPGLAEYTVESGE
jgi:biopolymer transport protein ExbB